jgi:hypothetical protein
MALGPNRQVFQTRIRYAVAAAAERGGILSASSTAGEALYDPDGSGALPLGLLLDDVEDLNFDRHPEYLQRNVVDIGSVVGIANEGEFQTDMYIASPAPSQGDPAYLHPSGFVGTVQLDDGVGTLGARVGTFLTAPNALGQVVLYVEL